MSYIDKLIEDCELAKKAKPVNEFVLNDLSELDGVKKAIYVIEEVGGDVHKTFSDFKQYREKRLRKCARLNVPSQVMYVGSSTTGVKNRIEQHIGKGHKGTYALHLNHWFKGKCKVTIKEYDVTKEVLQIIEDDLSDRLSPAFGKRGGNNK